MYLIKMNNNVIKTIIWLLFYVKKVAHKTWNKSLLLSLIRIKTTHQHWEES